MDSATTQRLLISLAATLCLILIHSPPVTSANENPTAYEVLQDYNFPVGLLPEGVLGYELNSTTGKFIAYLNDTCSFSEGAYQLKYLSTIKGNISNGKLDSLEGVSVKFFHVWMNIVEILRRGNDIDFSVGVGKAWFPIEYFEESPQCGCGMNCGRRQARKLLTNPSVSPKLVGAGN